METDRACDLSLKPDGIVQMSATPFQSRTGGFTNYLYDGVHIDDSYEKSWRCLGNSDAIISAHTVAS